MIPTNAEPFIKKYGVADFLYSLVNNYTFVIYKFKKEAGTYKNNELIISSENDPRIHLPFENDFEIENESDIIYLVNYNNQILYFNEDTWNNYGKLILAMSIKNDLEQLN